MTDKKQIAVRLDESQRVMLAAIAKENGRTQNQEIAYLVKQHIERFKRDNPEFQLDLLTK